MDFDTLMTLDSQYVAAANWDDANWDYLLSCWQDEQDFKNGQDFFL